VRAFYFATLRAGRAIADSKYHEGAEVSTAILRRSAERIQEEMGISAYLQTYREEGGDNGKVNLTIPSEGNIFTEGEFLIIIMIAFPYS